MEGIIALIVIISAGLLVGTWKASQEWTRLTGRIGDQQRQMDAQGEQLGERDRLIAAQREEIDHLRIEVDSLKAATRIKPISFMEQLEDLTAMVNYIGWEMDRQQLHEEEIRKNRQFAAEKVQEIRGRLSGFRGNGK